MNKNFTIQAVVSELKGKLSSYSGYGEKEVFEEFLERTIDQLGIRKSSSRRQSNERLVSEVKHFEDAYLDAVETCDPLTDILSLLYMELSGNKHLGQFFTPAALCDLCAQVSFDLADFDEVTGQGRFFRVHEPAVGAGGMLLALIKRVHSSGRDVRKMSIHAIDVDVKCCQMFAIQACANMLVHNICVGELLLYRGNALGPLDELTLYCGYQLKFDNSDEIETKTKAVIAA